MYVCVYLQKYLKLSNITHNNHHSTKEVSINWLCIHAYINFLKEKVEWMLLGFLNICIHALLCMCLCMCMLCFMFVLVFVYVMDIYVSTYMLVFVCACCVCLHVCVYVIYVCMCTCVCMCMCTCVCMCVCICTCVCMCTCVCVCVLIVNKCYVSMCVHVHACIHKRNEMLLPFFNIFL